MSSQAANDCSKPKEFDYVIVGGGIAGLYCARELSRLSPSASIAIFEKTNRLGGKIESFRFDPGRYEYDASREPDDDVLRRDEREILDRMRNVDKKIVEHSEQTSSGRRILRPADSILSEDDYMWYRRTMSDVLIAEFGPMRIEPDHQPLLSKLLSDLGFDKEDPACPTWSDLVPFSPFSGEPPSGLDFPLDGEEEEQESLLDLLLLSFRRILENIDDVPKELVKEGECDPRGNPDGDDLNRAISYLWGEVVDDNHVHRQHWKRNMRNWINSLHDGHYRFIRRHVSYKRTPLREMGFWNLIASVLSHMATVKLRDWGSFYHLLGDNPNAAEWLIFWLRALRTTDSLVSIRGGMDLIVEKLCVDDLGVRPNLWVRQKGGADRKAVVFFRHQLLQLDEICPEDQNYRVRLTFQVSSLEKNEEAEQETSDEAEQETSDEAEQETSDEAEQETSDEAEQETSEEDNEDDESPEMKVVHAKHVILALPRGPLRRLVFGHVPYRNIRKFDHILDSVKPIPLLKCFVLFGRPFWEDDRPANRFAHTVPTREIHYWKNSAGSAGLVMLYTDDPGHEYWSNYILHKKVTLNSAGHQKWEVPDRSQSKAEVHTWEPDRTGRWKQSPWEPWQMEWEHGQIDLLEFGNDRLLRTFLAYAREGEAASTPESSVLAVAIRDWSLRPAEGATHYWRPGVNSDDLISYLSGFSLLADRAVAGGPIHICGEAYSDYHGFIEGALRSARRVLLNLSESAECGAPRVEELGARPRPVQVTFPQEVETSRKAKREGQ